MTRDVSRLPLRVAGPPAAARLVPGQLEDLAATRDAARAESLRAEGFAAATLSAVQVFERAVEELEREREDLLTQVAEYAGRIALDVASELLRKELQEGNYDIVAIVRAALAETAQGGAKTIRVHPEDAAALEGIPFRSGTTVQPDPAVRRADVHLETDQGLLVRDIDTCVEKIRENLLEALRR